MMLRLISAILLVIVAWSGATVADQFLRSDATFQTALTGANGTLTNAMLADMTQATVKGRAAAAGTGAPTDLTQTQLTALCNTVTSSLSGCVTAFPNNTTTFFRGDGTYAAPPDNGTVLLNTLTGSSSASLADTTNLTSTYKAYQVDFFGLIPAAAAQFQLKVSTDGGSSYLATTYVGATHSVSNGGVVAANFGGTFFPLSGTVNASANYGLNGRMLIFDPAGAARRTFFDALMDYQNSAGTGSANYNQYRSSGYQDGANTAINAIQFSFIGQNITSGVIKIYGVQ